MNIPWIHALNKFSDTQKDLSLHFTYAMLEFLKPAITFKNTSGTLSMYIQQNELMEQKSPKSLLFFLQITLYNKFSEELMIIDNNIKQKYADKKKLLQKQSKSDISDKQKKNNSDKLRLLSFDIDALKELIIITNRNMHAFYKDISTNQQINTLLENIELILNHDKNIIF
jgi:hypothetical protein